MSLKQKLFNKQNRQKKISSKSSTVIGHRPLQFLGGAWPRKDLSFLPRTNPIISPVCDDFDAWKSARELFLALAIVVVVSASGSPRSFPGRKAGQRQLEDEKRKNASYRMAVKGAIRSNETVRNDGFFGGVNRIGVAGESGGAGRKNRLY